MSEKNYLEQIYESMVILEGDNDLVALNERRLSPFLLEVTEAEIERQADKLQDRVERTRGELDTVISLLPDTMAYTKAFFSKLRDNTLPSPGALAKMMLRGNVKKMQAQMISWNAHLANIHASDSLLRKGGDVIKRRLSPVPGYKNADDVESLAAIIELIPDLDQKSLKVAMDRHWKPPPGDAKFLNKIMQVGGRIISMFGGDGLIGTLNKNRVFDEFVNLEKGQFENLVDGLPVAELEDTTPPPAEETALLDTAEDLADDPEVTSPDATTPDAAPGADSPEGGIGDVELPAAAPGETSPAEPTAAAVPRLKFTRKEEKYRRPPAHKRIAALKAALDSYGDILKKSMAGLKGDERKAAQKEREELRSAIADQVDAIVGPGANVVDESVMIRAKEIISGAASPRLNEQVEDFRRWRHLAGME